MLTTIGVIRTSRVATGRTSRRSVLALSLTAIAIPVPAATTTASAPTTIAVPTAAAIRTAGSLAAIRGRTVSVVTGTAVHG